MQIYSHIGCTYAYYMQIYLHMCEYMQLKFTRAEKKSFCDATSVTQLVASAPGGNRSITATSREETRFDQLQLQEQPSSS